MTTVEAPAVASSPVRWLAGLTMAGLPLAATVTTYQLWQDRLPDPLPSHWGAGGQVDGTTALDSLATVLGVVATVGLLAAAVGALVNTIPHRSRRVFIAAGAGVAILSGGLWLMIAWLALDAAHAQQAATPTWHVLAYTVALFGLPIAAFATCPAPPPHPAAVSHTAAGLPRVELPAGQPATYSELLHPSRTVVLALTSALLAPAVALAFWASPWAAAPLVLAWALAMLLLSVRVTIDGQGLRAGFGPWGWPRLTVGLHEIAQAQVTEVRPLEWGGWGYRVHPNGVRCLIMGRGPGVRLELSAKRAFVLSTRDPETVAGLINTLAEQHRSR